MKLLKIMVASMALGAVALAGCGAKKSKVVQATENMAEAVCKCTDMACAVAAVNKSSDELTKYKNEKLSEADEKAAKAASAKMAECMSKLTR